MTTIAPAVLYALFIWWFTTGLVLLLVLRRRKAVVASLIGAALLFPVSIYILAASSGQTSVAGAYIGFTAAILLWGTQETAFLTGAVTGPRARPCPAGVQGAARLRYAIGAILYHEIALLGSGLAVLVVTWDAPNQVGALTFLVLWVMRLSAKLNLFLGVPVLNDEVMPHQIAHLRSYFRRGPVTAFFPVAMGLAVLGLIALIEKASAPTSGPAGEVGYVLVAALLGLAILEHVFMLVPLPIDRLWAWSTGALRRKRSGLSEAPHDLPAGDIDRVVASAP